MVDSPSPEKENTQPTVFEQKLIAELAAMRRRLETLETRSSQQVTLDMVRRALDPLRQTAEYAAAKVSEISNAGGLPPEMRLRGHSGLGTLREGVNKFSVFPLYPIHHRFFPILPGPRYDSGGGEPIEIDVGRWYFWIDNTDTPPALVRVYAEWDRGVPTGSLVDGDNYVLATLTRSYASPSIALSFVSVDTNETQDTRTICKLRVRDESGTKVILGVEECYIQEDIYEAEPIEATEVGTDHETLNNLFPSGADYHYHLDDSQYAVLTGDTDGNLTPDNVVDADSLHTHSHDYLSDVGADDHHLENHQGRHLLGGADELTADRLDVDFGPTYYTRTTTALSTNVKHLTSHLNGIDLELGTIRTPYLKWYHADTDDYQDCRPTLPAGSFWYLEEINLDTQGESHFRMNYMCLPLYDVAGYCPYDATTAGTTPSVIDASTGSELELDIVDGVVEVSGTPWAGSFAAIDYATGAPVTLTFVAGLVDPVVTGAYTITDAVTGDTILIRVLDDGRIGG